MLHYLHILQLSNFSYFILRKQSFLNLPKWIKIFQQQAGSNALKVLVGTKKDLIKDQNKKNKNTFPQRFSKQQKTLQKQKDIKNQSNQIPPVDLKPDHYDFDNSISQVEKYYMLKQNNVTFTFETSALLNENIDEVFQEICKYLILKQMNNGPSSKKKDNSPQKNKQRVESEFKKRFTKFEQSDKISLEGIINPPQKQKRSCC